VRVGIQRVRNAAVGRAGWSGAGEEPCPLGMSRPCRCLRGTTDASAELRPSTACQVLEREQHRRASPASQQRVAVDSTRSSGLIALFYEFP